MIGLRRGVVALLEHSAEWEENAAATIRKLWEIFGAKAMDIQHIGSTSIARIQAKPIIDIAVAVHDIADATQLTARLEEAGFYFRRHGVSGDLLFVRGDLEKDIRTHHIHVVQCGSAEWNNYINFRDYLNAFPEEAAEYEKLKTSLARRYAGDRAAYTEGKSAYIGAILRKAFAWSFLGKSVAVQIDRPLGSVHPKHENIVYSVNCGYIPGVIGGDGEPMDAYVLGLERPTDAFCGKVVGIIYREDDVEDKFVVAPEGMVFYQNEIAEAVRFQERYFITRIEALYQKSCGAVLRRKSV